VLRIQAYQTLSESLSNKEEKSLNEETIKIAKPLLEEAKGDNKRLLDFGDRQA
jgi:hypothetical protein